MKISIAQTQALKGAIQHNIKQHLQLIHHAVELEADIIIFPELSITSYEPNLAKVLARTVDDVLFDPFQAIADEKAIIIGVGMPTKAERGEHISILIFQPSKVRTVYSKQLLHEDEIPFFIAGNQQQFVSIKGEKIAFGICYESLQEQHFLEANKEGATIYIASVAKPAGGVERAYKHYPKMAKEFKTPVLMANCVGCCDNFISVGQSAVWNREGKQLIALDQQNQGLLIYNTELDTAQTYQLRIEKGTLSDLDQLSGIYKAAKQALDKQGIFQWTSNYPTTTIIKHDLQQGVLFVLKWGRIIIGAVNLSEEQEEAYQQVDWKFDDAKVLVIHRLVINPVYQGQGYGNVLMDFCEAFAQKNHYTSIRLDAYSKNIAVVEWYKKRHYISRGQVFFPERTAPFYCMEKEM